jgi:hypothetical protein
MQKVELLEGNDESLRAYIIVLAALRKQVDAVVGGSDRVLPGSATANGYAPENC